MGGEEVDEREEEASFEIHLCIVGCNVRPLGLSPSAPENFEENVQHVSSARSFGENGSEVLVTILTDITKLPLDGVDA